MALKDHLHALARAAGYEVLRRSSDPVLVSLLQAYNELRVGPKPPATWLHALPRITSLAYLREALIAHSIDLIIDVGANRGQFALDARQIGYRGEIISFEPLRAHKENLEALAKKDGRWRILPYALGSTTGEQKLNVYRNDKFSSFHSINAGATLSFGSMVELDHTELVQVLTIDDLSDELGLIPKRRAMLKTDTQGHDAAVLRGAQRALRHIRFVLSEATVASLYDGSSTWEEIAGLLLPLGFARSGMFPIAYKPGTLALIELDCYFTREISEF